MRLFIKEVPFPFQALLAVTAIWAERHRFQAFDSNFFLAIETQSEIALTDSLQCSFDASEQRVLLCGLLEQQFLGQVAHRALAKVFGESCRTPRPSRWMLMRVRRISAR